MHSSDPLTHQTMTCDRLSNFCFLHSPTLSTPGSWSCFCVNLLSTPSPFIFLGSYRNSLICLQYPTACPLFFWWHLFILLVPDPSLHPLSDFLSLTFRVSSISPGLPQKPEHSSEMTLSIRFIPLSYFSVQILTAFWPESSILHSSLDLQCLLEKLPLNRQFISTSVNKQKRKTLSEGKKEQGLMHSRCIIAPAFITSIDTFLNVMNCMQILALAWNQRERNSCPLLKWDGIGHWRKSGESGMHTSDFELFMGD